MKHTQHRHFKTESFPRGPDQVRDPVAATQGDGLVGRTLLQESAPILAEPVTLRVVLADAHISCASVYEPAHSLDRLPHKLFGDISYPLKDCIGRLRSRSLLYVTFESMNLNLPCVGRPRRPPAWPGPSFRRAEGVRAEGVRGFAPSSLDVTLKFRCQGV